MNITDAHGTPMTGAEDITSKHISFDIDAIGKDLERFQSDPIVKSALEKGVDLRQYSRSIDKDINELEQQSIKDILKNIEGVGKLHKDIKYCDNILENMESILVGFQNNLGGISHDIKHLQEQSITMNQKLRNRKKLEKRLNAFLTHVAIAPGTVSGITETPASDSIYVSYLMELNTLLHFAKQPANVEIPFNEADINGDHETQVENVASNLNDGANARRKLSSNLSETLHSIRKQQKQASQSNNDKASNKTNTSDNGDMEDEEKSKTSFSLGENLSPRDTLAVQSTVPVLEELKQICIQKLKDFLVNTIKSFTTTKTNVQMLQQYLLKYKYYIIFLNMHSPSTYEDIVLCYTNTMGKVLHNLFKTYNAHLLKLQKTIANNKTALIGNENVNVTNSTASNFADKLGRTFNREQFNKSSKNLNKSSDTFSIGDRDGILQDVDAPPIIIHVAQAEKMCIPYEAIYRSIQKHLLDSATAEFDFTLKFFNTKSYEIFNTIYEQVLVLNVSNLEAYLNSSYDNVCVMLLIHLTHANRMIMQRRRIPCLDDYFDKIMILLWPKFKIIFDMNLMSIIDCDVQKLLNVNSSKTTTSASINSNSSTSTSIHYITRRYADFTISIYKLYFTIDFNNDERIEANLEVLRNEFNGLMLKITNQENGKKSLKSQTIFLINNYDHILRAYDETTFTSPLGKTDSNKKYQQQQKYFADLLSQQIHSFVETELSENYQSLIDLVKTVEPMLQQKQHITNDVKGNIASVASDFSKSWKNGVKQINQSVLCFFSNFKNGMDILKKVLTQLLLYYTRFQDIVKRVYSDNGVVPPFNKEMVAVHSIIYEIKKYSRTF